MKPSTRRQFLKTAAMAGVAGAAWQPWMQMQAMAQAASSGASDYKAMVCLFMYGGNDANNMLLPYEQADYSLYTRARANLALDRGSVLPIAPSNTGGKRYALHPEFTQLKSMFDAGKVAMLANIGPLMEPTTPDQFKNRSVALPPNLFSHSDQQNQWQTDAFTSSTRGGWGGRMLERLVAEGTANRGYSCVSVTGSALWGTGDQTLLPYRVPSSGRFGLDFYTPGGTDPLSIALAGLMSDVRTDAFEVTWLNALRRAMDNQRVLASALDKSATATTFPDTEIGGQLRMISKLIKAHEQLGLKRQCFFCSMGGFDTHGDDQLFFQQDAFSDMDDAIKLFMDEMKAQGLENQVTLFTASDFNRTLVSNGKGSDHGWGSHHLVVGGAVQGGKLYGRFPNHTVNGPDDIGGGNFVPALALDQLGAELGRWFGAGSVLNEVFPRLSRFNTNLGLMGT